MHLCAPTLLALLLLAPACRKPAPAPPADPDRSAPAGAPDADEQPTPLIPRSSPDTPHWTFPVPAQGEPPSHWSAGEKSLLPTDCGVCHPVQFADWKGSFHAAAFSPGLTGQFGGFSDATVSGCYRCHAPLTEQQTKLPDADGNYLPNPLLNETLRNHGVACAACHVRDHERKGPPPKDGAERDMSALPHGGFVIDETYTRSEFCSFCHQFPDTWRSFNGKLLENTYNEWKDWAQSEFGSIEPGTAKQCQDCHMPDRRHLFKGIHDKETTASAFEFAVAAPYRAPDGGVELAMSLRNTGAGHMAPTYTTPRIYMEFLAISATGEILSEDPEPTVIGREVLLGTGDDREVFDTRVAPGASIRHARSGPVPEGTAALLARVRVAPDYHYEGLYEGLLKRLDEGSEDHGKISEALRLARANRYLLFEERVELRDP